MERNHGVSDSEKDGSVLPGYNHLKCDEIVWFGKRMSVRFLLLLTSGLFLLASQYLGLKHGPCLKEFSFKSIRSFSALLSPLEC